MWEVGLDFGFGTAVNLGFQAICLRTFTLSRGFGFTSAFLLLALARRYSMRRGFNCLVQQGQKQSWRMSLVEAVADTWCAIIVALGLLAFWYPDESWLRVGSFIGASYVLTPLWRFVLRRLCESRPGIKRGERRSSTMRNQDGTSHEAHTV
jgi:hypothetical protein